MVKKSTKSNKTLANLSAVVQVKGNRKKSLERIYETFAPRSRNQVNPLTGVPFTQVGEMIFLGGKKNNYIMQFEIVRLSILGNYQNDIEEFIRKAAAKLNVTVNVTMDRISRVELE